MNRDALMAAMAEARRFLERADAIEWHKVPFAAQPGCAVDPEYGIWYPDDFTQTAAARRASLDLTRALAQWRQS